MLNQVQYQKASIVVNKDGKPVAALVDADLFARIRAMRERFDPLNSFKRHLGLQVTAENFSCPFCHYLLLLRAS